MNEKKNIKNKNEIKVNKNYVDEVINDCLLVKFRQLRKLKIN